MFRVEDRKLVHAQILEWAATDLRVVAGAVVGSLALSEEDRWSDLDLTFAVADGLSLADVLGDWARMVTSKFDAAELFDLTVGTSIYRVFLLPGCLQFDLSFTPASHFGAIGPKFKLLFGTAVKKAHIQPTPIRELLGYAVHHAVRARVCIERGRYWQAEYWMSGARDYALSLACRRRDLPSAHGRGFDDLPQDVRGQFIGTFTNSVERKSLLLALHAVVTGLLQEASDLNDSHKKIVLRLQELLQRDAQPKPSIE